MEHEIIKKLIVEALKQREYAYAPYSNFRVGAALLTGNGQIITGCNIENAAFSPTNCAERTAFFKAVSEGVHTFKAICIAGGKEEQPEEYIYPCGMCRQVMSEFCDPDSFIIISAIDQKQYETYLLKELFPNGFYPKNLE